MSEAKQRETPKAAAAFHEYCLLGHDRSLVKLAQKLGKIPSYTRCLETWSAQYNWQERVQAYDAQWMEEQDEIIRQERERVLRLGFALDYKRIEALNKLAEKLMQWTEEDDKVWIVNTKTVTGENFSQHTEETVFNAPMLGMIEKYFAGIAAEKGERVKKKDITITEMPPSVYLDFDPDQDGVTKEGDDGSEALPDNEL
jgi:hypothetical protein